MATIAVLAGCSVVPGVYKTNSLVVLDGLEKASAWAVMDMPSTEEDRVAVYALDSTQGDLGYPPALVYDMLTHALRTKGVTVVDRDVESLYHAILEGWADKIPFQASPLCTDDCGDPPPAGLPVSMAAPTAQEAKQGKSKGGGEPVAATAQVTVTMPTCSSSPGGTGSVPPAPPGDLVNSPHYDRLLMMNIPGWLDADGERIVSEKDSATLVLGYRVLSLGVALEPTNLTRPADVGARTHKALFAPDTLDRVVRVDMLLRLTDTRTGKVAWTKRASFQSRDKIPDYMRSYVSGDRFKFAPPEIRPAAAGGSEDQGGMFDGLFGD